ncbi:MAG: hypothetical protein HUJ11_06400 [Arenibacter algicola]|nr:hypothetical protein [Arenibacter algicola]
MDLIAEILELKRKINQLITRRANPQPRPQIRKAVIVQLGDFDVHQIEFTDGNFTEDLETDDLTRSYRGNKAYVGDELDLELEPLMSVFVTLCEGRWWIVAVVDQCQKYCIDPDFTGDSYIYGWTFRAPNLPCCPEAGGAHILTTSDSGVTYESDTFQCNSDGTNRNWVFKDRKLRLSPMLDDGNVEYWSDQTPNSCTIQLNRFEPQRFPAKTDCGTLPQSICLHPLCGVGSCAACNGLTIMEWEIDFGGGGESNPYYLPTVFDYCDSPSGVIRVYQAFHNASTGYCIWTYYSGTMFATMSISTADPPVMAVTGYELGSGAQGVSWTAEGPFDCDSEITLTVDYDDDINPTRCIGYPEAITVRPVRGPHLDDNCYPTVVHSMPSASDCTRIPFYAELELTGITDGTCNECSQLNDVFRLDLPSTVGPNYISDSISSSCLSETTTSPVFKIITDGGGDQYYLQFGNATAVYKKTGLASWNCFGPNVFTYDSDDGRCGNWPGTITLYPMLPTD